MESTTSRPDTGDLLVKQGHITEKQLELVRRRQERLQLAQHRAVVDLNFASEELVYQALAELNHLSFVDISNSAPAKNVLEAVPVKMIFHYRMFPLSLENDLLTLALSEPLQPLEQGNLRLQLGKRLKIVLTTPSCLHAVIKKHFGLGAATIQKLREGRSKDDASQEILFDVKSTDEGTIVDPSIIDFVDQLLSEAMRLQATDIHIEPYFSTVRLRYRIDGIMQTVPAPDGLRQLYGSIVSRLKIMAGLNIAEKRLPHDGHIAMKTNGEEYDLRVSVIPTKHGEAVCLRILGRQNLFLDVNQLGMEAEHEALFEEMIRLPQGLILLTGPTGSGKTTTLYAALTHANDESRKILTIEDPVEYQLEGATQIQVRDDIGLTFSSAIRSILRHDPDIILVGEIRDAETAEIAIRAAQTGHLVFATLHTNDSISAVTRLLEMKIDSFLIGSSLVCSIAQRLARRICRHCLVEDTEIPETIRQEMARTLGIPLTEVKAFKGTGCIECNKNGYRGRVALYEFFVVNDALADAINPGVKAGHLRELASEYGWRSLRDEAWAKVQTGIISIEEQQRLTRRINGVAMKSVP
ncbi:MAG: type II/IV secretion system protein [Verrucomicrobia bacterium]|nr:type II/IV secretion system protein [Verrucomicrobiota bacterium]